MALLTDIAEAVKTAINGRAWGVPLTAVRATRPRWTLAELATLRCAVIGRTVSVEPFTRAAVRKIVTIEISLMQRVADQAAIDALENLSEAMLDFFRPAVLFPSLPTVAGVGARLANNQTTSTESLDQHNVFNGSILLEFVSPR